MCIKVATVNLETIKKNVFENSLNTCEYIDGYQKRDSIIQVHCLIHDLNFFTKYENVARASRKHHICPQCQKEDKDLRFKDNRIITKCAYCGKEIVKQKSDQNYTKSGLFFCCREHKDLAQRIESGKKFDTIRPSHYGTFNSGTEYRKIAFRNYEHKCEVCGYDEDEDVLQVHHIDENRNNAKLENLIILCPTCHWKLTIGKYELIGREKIVLKQEK